MASPSAQLIYVAIFSGAMIIIMMELHGIELWLWGSIELLLVGVLQADNDRYDIIQAKLLLECICICCAGAIVYQLLKYIL